MVASTQEMKDACEYVMTVKKKFHDKRETYNTFLKIMKDFKARRIGRSCVRSKVKNLFKDHKDLLLVFNNFLPMDYKITFDTDQTPPRKPVFWDAIDFVRKVKARFQHNDRPYISFLNILHMYLIEKKSVVEVCHEVLNVLFRDQHDLRVEFMQFLPRYRQYYTEG